MKETGCCKLYVHDMYQNMRYVYIVTD